MKENTDIVYRIDSDDRIVEVNEAWDRFARANGGEAVLSRHVLNTLLWDHIVDETTCELYRQVIERVRSGQILTFELRCDAPALRRFLEMKISLLDDDTVRFRTRLLTEEQRRMQRLLDPQLARSDVSIPLCGWCNRLNVGEHWLEIEEGIQHLRLMEKTLMPSLNRIICEECCRKMNWVVAET